MNVPAGEGSPGWISAEYIFQQDPSRQVLRQIHLETELRQSADVNVSYQTFTMGKQTSSKP